MTCSPSPDQAVVLAVAFTWNRLQRRLDGALNQIKGISFAEYRLLRCLADTPNGRVSRVDLAEMVGLSPSGVTRALKPLERLGFVETHRSDRDARRALAGLTTSGMELVDDSCALIDEASAEILESAPGVAAQSDQLLAHLHELT